MEQLRQSVDAMVIGMVEQEKRKRGFGERDKYLLPGQTKSKIRKIEVRGDCLEPFFHSGDIVLIRTPNTLALEQKGFAQRPDKSTSCAIC